MLCPVKPAAAVPIGAASAGSARRSSGTHGYEVLDRLATTQETAMVDELGRIDATPSKLEMQPDRSVTNREIIKLLERSLESEPHRVDIQLKLLEMRRLDDSKTDPGADLTAEAAL